ncbi:acyltransferase family protein [Bradyrhizobium sp. STM 3561]|uniref:acyltransferase family protein n=1 Tax=Bradyrhizobium sp. STM 3561 TaxID=578923 RepID=UPI00388F5581
MDGNEPRRFVVLDFYRFVAALGVFVFHLKNIDPGISPAWNGSFGLFVDMFFILSGFVISYSYPANSGEGHSYLRFMLRRIARIYPLHLLTLLAFGGVAFIGIHDSASHTSVSDFIYNLFLVQAWGVTDHLSFNTPAWSISAELFCYLLFPLLMYLARSVSPVLLALIVAASYGILAHGHLPIWHERSQMYGANFDYGMLRALPSFLNGILLAILFRLSGSYRKRVVIFLGVAVFAMAVLILNIFAKPDLAIILFSLAILLTAVGESALDRVPGAAWLGRLGNTSYSVYMLHELLIILVFLPIWRHFSLGPKDFPMFVLACCLLLMITADVTYAYVERPARDWINRYGRPRSRQVLTTASLDTAVVESANAR